jgi:hypothetical protein
LCRGVIGSGREVGQVVSTTSIAVDGIPTPAFCVRTCGSFRRDPRGDKGVAEIGLSP